MKRQKTDSLDRQLSYRFKKALGDDGRGDWFDVRERAGMSRTLWRWSQRRMLLVAGVLVLAVGAAGASTGIIPWLSDTPKPIPPTIYPICGANDVQAKLDLHKSSQTRELSGSIALINTGNNLCALEGQPKVSLTGSGADSTPLQVEMFSPVAKLPKADKTLFGSWNPDQTLLGRDFEPPNNSAVSFGWENWCGRDSTELALRIELPNGSKFTLPVTKLPGCDNSAKPSRIVFGRANGAPPPLGPDFPLRPKILAGEDGQPLVLEQGKALHYRVALTNTSSNPYSFGDSCPVYQQMASMQRPYDSPHDSANPAYPLVDTFTWGQYVLNCDSVGVVEPGETVTFAMELPASKDARDAKGELFWLLPAPAPAPWIWAQVPITVVGKTPGNYSASDSYRILTPGTREVVLPDMAQDMALSLEGRYGPIVPGTRKLLLGKGEPNGPAYGWATESGSACFFTKTEGGCDEGATQIKPAQVGVGWGSASPTVVSGEARDQVKRVDAIVNGKLLPVSLKNNIVYAEFPNGSTVSYIVLTMDDGSKVKIKQGSQDLAGTVSLR
jgi:hypothetical protein